MVTYITEAESADINSAREIVARAFHLSIQVSKVRMGRRVISEITELEDVHEGSGQRRVPLYVYDRSTDSFQRVGTPTKRLHEAWERYGVNCDG